MVAAPREVAFLTNPTAGRGRASRARDTALHTLRRSGLSVRSLQGDDAAEALDLARTAVADGVDTLVVCGGDGSVQLGARAVAGTATRLGIVPAGSGNDAARCLGLPRGNAVAAAEIVVRGRIRTVDLAQAHAADGSEGLCVTVLATGFDALVNARADRMRWPRGPARFPLATLLELPTFDPLDYALQLDGSAHEVQAMLVAVGNGDRYGGGLRITEGADLDDGLLDVVVIRPMSRRRLVRLFPRLYAGTHAQSPEYEHHRVRSVTVGAGRPVVAYADGERLGPLPVHVEVRRAALTVLA